MKRIFFFSFIISASVISLPQKDTTDESIERANRLTAGIGYDLNPPSYGIQLTASYSDFNFGLTYYMPRSSTDKYIQDIKNGFIIKGGISPLYLYSFKYIFPIYLGFGYSLINEKEKVLNYSGGGKITGLHYYIGIQSLPNRDGFWGSLGVHLEMGYSSWDYDNSVLKKNNSDKEYNYSKFFFSFGLAYYFL